MTVGETVEQYVSGRRARREITEATAKSFQGTLRPLARALGGLDISEVTYDDLRGYVEAMAPTVSTATTALRVQVIKHFFVELLAAGVITDDPAFRLRAPKRPRSVPRWIPDEEIQQALDACDSFREQLILALMVEEGMRSVEISRLQMADFDLGARLVIATGKGGHQRTLPITDDCWDALRRYLGERGRATGPLIRSEMRHSSESEGLLPARVVRIASEALHRVGITESGHALRHTFAQNMLESGATIRQVQHALGHASLATTQRYLRAVQTATIRQFMGRRAASVSRESEAAA